MCLIKHWEHTEVITVREHEEFTRYNKPVSIKDADIPANTAVYLQCEDGSQRLEGVYDDSLKGVRQLQSYNNKNRELRLYEDALSSEHITVLAVDGLMGTGKTSTVIKHLIDTHLADKMADARSVWEKKDIEHKILIAKPIVNSGGEEYGFLPGDIYEKVVPSLRNYTQYFDRWHQAGFSMLNEAGYVEILPLGFVRGMDIEDTTVVVDECQNTQELVTMVTRRSKGSSIILLGDTSPFQIDSKGNSTKKNGLTHAIDLLQGASYFQYIDMKSVNNIIRSEETRDIVRRLYNKYGEDIENWKV